ncbi:MAG: DUF4097 family beta strand repeat-containing protein [Bacteroidota bacterium]
MTPRSVFQRIALVVIGALVLVLATATFSHANHLVHADEDRFVHIDQHEHVDVHEHEERVERQFERIALVASSVKTESTIFLQESFDVRDGEMLDLNLGTDDIIIETVRGNTAEVIIEGTGRDAQEVFERREYQVFHENGRLTVRTKPNRQRGNWQRNRSYRASFTTTVRIPERFDASIDVGSGDVRLDRLAGDLNVDTGSGEVRIGSVNGGEIRIDTGSGDVEAERLDGSSVRIDTGSGEVTVGYLAGRSSIDTGSGDVVVSMDAGHDLDVSTGSGEVDITLPRNAGAELAIDSRDVDIDRDFSFDGRSTRSSTRGTLGNGGSRIEVSTGSGEVSLHAR